MKDNQKELLYFLRAEKANFTTADKTDVIELIRLICKNVKNSFINNYCGYIESQIKSINNFC